MVSRSSPDHYRMTAHTPSFPTCEQTTAKQKRLCSDSNYWSNFALVSRGLLVKSRTETAGDYRNPLGPIPGG